ncbi:hypothetical protein EDB80DRAFT_366870 [Ilyonectria destructans]|nr:hypothetical protein EDB80DRAFT_366870 [Ilyonectria destructans]
MSVGWWLRWPCAAGSGAWDEPKMASRFCRLVFPCRSLSTNALTAVRTSGLGKSSARKRKPRDGRGHLRDLLAPLWATCLKPPGLGSTNQPRSRIANPCRFFRWVSGIQRFNVSNVQGPSTRGQGGQGGWVMVVGTMPSRGGGTANEMRDKRGRGQA